MYKEHAVIDGIVLIAFRFQSEFGHHEGGHGPAPEEHVLIAFRLLSEVGHSMPMIETNAKLAKS